EHTNNDLSGVYKVPTTDLDDDDITTSDLTDQQVGETPRTAVFDPDAAGSGPAPDDQVGQTPRTAVFDPDAAAGGPAPGGTAVFDPDDPAFSGGAEEADDKKGGRFNKLLGSIKEGDRKSTRL